MRILRKLWVGFALLTSTNSIAEVPQTVSDFDGLWVARTRHGPDVKGPLRIYREGNDLIADIAGQRAVVKTKNGALSFELRSDEGSFRGHYVSGQKGISGHWIQPRTQVGGGQRFASPVMLVRNRMGDWAGNIVPLADEMTMFLVIKTEASGKASAFIRNPERNIGIFANARHLERSGNAVSLVGSVGKTGPDAVLADGRYDDNNDLLSLHFSRFGTTLDFQRAGHDAEAIFYPRGKNPPPYRYSVPPVMGDGWPTGNLKDAQIDPAGLSSFIQMLTHTPMDNLHAPQIHSVLIARHGKLVVEEYFHGEHRDKLHDTRSAAKSMTSLLVGATMASGGGFTTASPVVENVDPSLLPAKVDPRLKAMTVKDLLTMSSGLACDDGDPTSAGNEDVMQGQRKENNWWRYTLALPMAAEPGAKSVYCSCNPNLLGAVLSYKTKKWLPELFDQLLAKPLQIDRYAINLSPTGDSYLGGGAYFLPRDFMKLGQLLLNKGAWNHKQIVDANFVRDASAAQTELEGLHYGYLWWGIDLPYRGETMRAVYAGGNGGQVVMVIPALDLVVAFYGGNYSDPVMYEAQRVLVPKYILPAVNR